MKYRFWCYLDPIGVQTGACGPDDVYWSKPINGADCSSKVCGGPWGFKPCEVQYTSAQVNLVPDRNCRCVTDSMAAEAHLMQLFPKNALATLDDDYLDGGVDAEAGSDLFGRECRYHTTSKKSPEW